MAQAEQVPADVGPDEPAVRARAALSRHPRSAREERTEQVVSPDGPARHPPGSCRYAGRFKGTFTTGRIEIPHILLKSADAELRPAAAGGGGVRKSWISIYQGFKQVRRARRRRARAAPGGGDAD